MNILKKVSIDMNVSASSKTLRYGLLIVGCILVLLVTSLSYQLISTKNYVKVNSKIIDITERRHPRNTYSYYIKYQYKYKSNQYSVVQESSIKPKQKVGENVYIYCNPQNPKEIKNSQIIIIEVIGIIISSLLVGFLLIAYKKEK